MLSTNVMNEQTDNKQTNCFLKIFIRKPTSLPLKSIYTTLTGSRGRGSIPTSKIGVSTWQKLISDRAHFQLYLENSIKNI